MAQKVIYAIVKNKRKTASEWALENPILQDGQIGIESDSRRFKVGDGATTWNSLDYAVDNYFYGHNEVTTLTSLPISKRVVIATVVSATTLSLSSTLSAGLDLHIKLYNTSGNTITQPLPTTNPFESKKVDGSNVNSISIPAGGAAEINIISAGNKYIIKTDA